ncbi:MAG: polyprenyl synthetase family protein, partial [Vulcanococcus sp.]
MATVAELLQPVEADLEALLSDLRSLIGAGHPILQAAAEHLFSAGGKRLRPGIVLLISRALAADGELSSRHRRLAEITEMIHTASLVHDDVVDEASTRRGVDTVHSRFNHRVAVLAGDFLFAQASWHLANLDDLEVVKLLSRAIAADGGLSARHRRLAEITEMIHTASLVHDDVVDGAATRRGVATVHSRFNHRVAVLAGDFLFAQASWHLANLDDLEVVKLLSRVIMDLADGEVKQG